MTHEDAQVRLQAALQVMREAREVPFARAARVYEREACARPLVADLEAHLLYGYVISTPEVFLMGRRVRSGWPDETLRDPYATAPDGDCWHVWLCGGSMREALRRMPFRLPWLSYERSNRIRRVRLDRFDKEWAAAMAERWARRAELARRLAFGE